MEIEIFKKANEIQNHIDFWEKELKQFKIDDSCCYHLQLQDHYGNKGSIIKLYAYESGNIKIEGIDDLLREQFKVFILKSHNIISKRINNLKEQLKEL